MEKDKEFLANAPIGRLLFKLALPTVTAQIINMLYNMVDRIFIGKMPVVGDLALTGVGVCLPIIMIVSAFAALVASGGAPRASIFMGKKDNQTAEKILGNCFTLQIIISVILTVVLLLFNREMLLAFGASEKTIEYATSYMNVYAIGTLFVQLTLGMNAFVTAQGFTKVSMISVLIGAVCNICLDPLFIYAFNMGVKGAALATIISQGISCIFVLSFLVGKKTLLKIRKENLGISLKIILPCIALGLATFVMQGSESVICVCFNSSLQKYGGDLAVGAMTILSSVMQFAMLPMQGVAQGAQPILSYNYGAKNGVRVKKTFTILLITCLCYSCAIWGAVNIMPGVFASLFTDSKELIEICKKVMPIYFGSMFLFGAQIACQMTFVSLGNAPSSVMVAVVRKFVLLLPLIYVMPRLVQDKTLAVYLAEPIADFIAVTFTVILFVFQFKKALKKIQQKVVFNPTKKIY